MDHADAASPGYLGAFGYAGDGATITEDDLTVDLGRIQGIGEAAPGFIRVCAIGDEYGLKLSNVFHAGDGNLHPNISFDRRDGDEFERVVAAGEAILRLCVEKGGVITGEHGIGSEKKEYMGLVFSEADLEAMKRLRGAFDPDGVCNPGKIFPTTRFCVEANPKARGYDRVPFE